LNRAWKQNAAFVLILRFYFTTPNPIKYFLGVVPNFFLKAAIKWLNKKIEIGG